MKTYELTPNGTQKSFYGLNKAGFMGLEHETTPQEKAN